MTGYQLMKSTEGDVRATRLKKLPKYLFEELAETKRRKEASGLEVIDLSIGDPELGAPPAALDALRRNAEDRRLHRYTPYFAVEKFCRRAAAWMKARFGIDLDPTREVLPLLGTKEGIANLPLAVLDPGQRALVPDPGYPVYSRGVWFAGGEVEWMPLEEDSGFLPDIDSVRRVRPHLVYVNYPNNPTSAIANAGFYSKLVEAARDVGALVVADKKGKPVGMIDERDLLGLA